MQHLLRLFVVERSQNLVVCEKRDGDYVLRFHPRLLARRCWLVIGSSGRWNGELCEKDGEIRYPEDLISEQHLREIAVQILDGKSRIEFSEDEDEDDVGWEDS